MRVSLLLMYSLVTLLLSGSLLVSAETKQSSCITLTSPLTVGSRDTTTNGQVSILQQFLKDNNYLTDAPTGYFGTVTKKAVQAFQKDRALEQVGSTGPATRRAVHSLSCVAQVSSALVPPKNTYTQSFSESFPYRAYVNSRVAIDASLVTREYATVSCKKLADKNLESAVKCLWGGKEFYAYVPPVIDIPVQVTPITIATGESSSSVVQSVSSGTPSVALLISPTSVPYKGGYDSFELKTNKMESCILYFKDEPSTKWISAGSLGGNYSLPGYKGLTKSMSFYSVCKDSLGVSFDSNIVTITVAPE